MGLDYKKAGVDIDKGDSLIPVYRDIAEKTKVPGVMGSLGGFGSLFSLAEYNMQDPVLVSGTDGVGTKLLLAKETGIHNTIGIDLVAMCVNDIITCGAQPLFFLDYFASGVLDAAQAAEVVRGIGEGCLQAGCALVGGETAELPGMYAPGDYDLAGFAVGVVDRSAMITGDLISAGDVLIGMSSSGLHSNGYSLARAIVKEAGLALDEAHGLELSLGEALLAPTILYSGAVAALKQAGTVHGLAHITGGGLPGNACRILPEGTAMEIHKDAWERPALFSLLQEKGGVAEEEMYRVFNMGIGMVAVVPEAQADAAISALHAADYEASRIGSIIAGNREVLLL